MTTDDGIRASDSDREQVVTILRDAYVAGRLTLAEFDQRTSAAFASRTWGELRKLTSDLPAKPALGVVVPAPASPPREPAPAQASAPGPPPATGTTRPPGHLGMARLLPALPIVLVWVVIALSARGASAYIPLLFLLLVGLKIAGSRPRHGRDRSGQQPHSRRDRPF